MPPALDCPEMSRFLGLRVEAGKYLTISLEGEVELLIHIVC